MTSAALSAADERTIIARTSGTPLVLLFDIDGTLAPIAPRPADVVIPETTLALLRAFADMPDVVVGIVTGRSIADAARLVDIPHAWMIGNHGFEIRDRSGALTGEPRAEPYLDRVARAAATLATRVDGEPGLVLEDKHWTLSVHYRTAPREIVGEITALVNETAKANGLIVTSGKEVLELRPPVDVHKGSAAVALVEHEGGLAAGASVFYSGDDRTDEDAFRELRLARPDAVTIRVHAGAATDTAAEFTVESPVDLAAILEKILAKHRADG